MNEAEINQLKKDYTQYGAAAIISLKYIFKYYQDKIITPELVVSEYQKMLSLYTKSESSKSKYCPTQVLLGLFFNGHIIIPSDVKVQKIKISSRPYEYAKIMIDLLKNCPSLSSNKKILWEELEKRVNKKRAPQGEIDIVLALYNKNLLNLF